MELILHGFPAPDAPRILHTYLFCCPGMDGNFRCLPREGGYYDQDHADMLAFEVIEKRIGDWQKRERQKEQGKKK